MEARRDTSGLLVMRGPRAQPTLRRVVAIPHAGAGPNTVAIWADAVDEGTETLFVRLPGREMRFGEQPLVDAHEAARQVAEAIGSLAPLPTALVGHSMGSLVAYLTAVRLARAGFGHLSGLIVSGLNPPHADTLCPRVGGMADAEFVSMLDRLGGLPAGLSDNGELIDLLLPLLRADFRLVETYRHVDTDPIPVWIVAISGDQDCLAPHDTAIGWGRYTDAGFHSVTHEGDHFSIMDPKGTWRNALSTALALIWENRTCSEASREAIVSRNP
jgi:surfactin synthase thioesterase subunit